MKIYDKIQKVRVLRTNLSVANLNKRPKKIILLTIIFVVILLFTSPLMNLPIDMNKPIDDELIPFNDDSNLNSQGIYTKEFVLGISSGPYDLEPQSAWDSSSIDVIDQVCEGLYKYNLSDPDHAIIPNLATAFGTWSSDKKNYTIPLREGVLFHDYALFDAYSVEWSFNRLQYFLNATGSLPEGKQVTKIAELYIWPDGTPIINRTEIVNAYTIKFILNKPFVPLLGLLCFSGSYILSPWSTPAYDYIDTNTGDLIGTGPFVYDRYNLDVNVTYHAFENYWRGKAKIESLIFKIIPDANERNNALLSGDIDLLGGISFSYLDQMESDPDITVTPCDQSLTIQYIGMNNKQINKTWRKAISYAINYSYIIDTLMGGQAERMKSPVPEGILYGNWSFDVATYNLTKAREYMVSMGYGDLGWSNAAWQAATFATFNYTYNTGNWMREHLLTLLQDNLDLIGIEVTAAGMTWGDYLNTLYYSHDKLQLYWIGWSPDYNDPSNFINPLLSNTSLSNSASVNDPYLESLMEAGLEETDPILREAIYDETQRYIVEDLMPWAFGYVGNYYDAYQSVFTGYPSNRMRKVWLYNVSLSVYKGGKIHIKGNQEWLDFKNAGGCTGQGTYSDPYVIEDLIIGDIGGYDYCISIENTDVNFRIENCTLYNSYAGIQLYNASNGMLISNNCTEISYNNIGLAYCNNTTISNNTVGSILGLGFCNNTTISNNTINNTLYVIFCNNTEISNNTVGNSFSSSSYYMPNGIALTETNNITFSGNLMFNGGIGMGGTIDALLSTKIDTTNLVNGKPILYYANKIDLGPKNFTNAGQVILVNCSDSIVNNLNFSRVLVGISLNYCRNITISNVVVSDNFYIGIYLFWSSQINCSNVRISSGSGSIAGIYSGILLHYCNNSLISNNYISNITNGMSIQMSHNNTFLRNTVVNSTNYGISLHDSNNNTIYLNNFINNSLDVSSYESTNIWNSSVKIAYTYNNIDYFNYLGNYWGNYTGNDANNDGIGDTSYIIYENKEDNYPLMEPFENYLIPPAAEDTTAPATISDLTTSNPTENSVILNWTAPGDDGNTGTASGYIVKYSTSGPINDSNWDSASTYAQSWTPLTAGSKETHVVSGLDPDTQYWFAIKAYDEVPNYGYISNTASEKTLDINSKPPLIAGYSWIVLIFSLYFAISIVILIIKRKINTKF